MVRPRQLGRSETEGGPHHLRRGRPPSQRDDDDRNLPGHWWGQPPSSICSESPRLVDLSLLNLANSSQPPSLVGEDAGMWRWLGAAAARSRTTRSARSRQTKVLCWGVLCCWGMWFFLVPYPGHARPWPRPARHRARYPIFFSEASSQATPKPPGPLCLRRKPSH